MAILVPDFLSRPATPVAMPATLSRPAPAPVLANSLSEILSSPARQVIHAGPRPLDQRRLATLPVPPVTAPSAPGPATGPAPAAPVPTRAAARRP